MEMNNNITSSPKRFTKVKAVNLKEQRRIIAKKVIEENKYCY